jgi:hypothetical protein
VLGALLGGGEGLAHEKAEGRPVVPLACGHGTPAGRWDLVMLRLYRVGRKDFVNMGAGQEVGSRLGERNWEG